MADDLVEFLLEAADDDPRLFIKEKFKSAAARIGELEDENKQWSKFGNDCLEDLSRATKELVTTIDMLKEREKTIEILKGVCKKQNDIMGKMSHQIDDLAALAGIQPKPLH